MKRGLHKYRLQLQYEHDNFRWNKRANFAIVGGGGGGVEEFLGKH
jgi:NADH dehydrogenase FAD-containing subunit